MPRKHEIVEATELQKGDTIYIPDEIVPEKCKGFNIWHVAKRTKDSVLLHYYIGGRPHYWHSVKGLKGKKVCRLLDD